MEKTTEKDSPHRHLEQLSAGELLRRINDEDKTVPFAIEKALPQIEAAAEAIYKQMKDGGRLFYIGSGTSGRLGVVDASECPPTYGVPFDWVIGIIAGGEAAIRKAQEGAEDDTAGAWRDLEEYGANEGDFVLGISASGTTPYVLGGLRDCRKHSIPTGCLVCNEGSPIAAEAEFPIEVVVGPEFVTGSTRMKAGTAQKLVLNMLSTTVMIRLGRVKDNKMVDMRLSNDKLIDRGTRILMNLYSWEYDLAKERLLQWGSVREVINWTEK